MTAFRSSLFCLLALPIGAYAQQSHDPRMQYLDNGTLRVGIDLNLGGAITWLSRAGDQQNLVNSYDWGRQVQMSYYSGPVPFAPDGKKLAPEWRGLGWNPIQVGDAFGHRSRILDFKENEHGLYVKCIPMQWPLEDAPGECTFESWVELQGASVAVRCRLANQRTDKQQYPARMQELPAVYANAPFSHIASYTGDRPYEGEPVTRLPAAPPPGWGLPWIATENWSALLNDAGWGLGVWNPDCPRFKGGFSGKPGEGQAKSASCGYLSPIREEILDHNIVHNYRYNLFIGTVDEIRANVYRLHTPGELPSWKFEADRQGWHYHQAKDDGWPIAGELNVQFEKGDPQVISPVFFARAEVAPVLVIEAAFSTHEPNAQIFWNTVAEPAFSEKRSMLFPVTSDEQFHAYRVRLDGSKWYAGGIVQLRLDPANDSAGAVRIRAVRFAK